MRIETLTNVVSFNFLASKYRGLLFVRCIYTHWWFTCKNKYDSSSYHICLANIHRSLCAWINIARITYSGCIDTNFLSILDAYSPVRRHTYLVGSCRFKRYTNHISFRAYETGHVSVSTEVYNYDAKPKKWAKANVCACTKNLHA